jgi:hypothetical protein
MARVEYERDRSLRERSANARAVTAIDIKGHINDCRRNVRMRDERERISDIGGSNYTGAGEAQLFENFKRNKRLIFNDEHGAP